MTRRDDTTACRKSLSPGNAHGKTLPPARTSSRENITAPHGFLPAGPFYSIFSLKRFAFQTIRPGVLKKGSFSSKFRNDGAVPPVVPDAFRKRQPGNNYDTPRPYRRETATSGKRARPRNAPFSRIKRVGGRKHPCAPAATEWRPQAVPVRRCRSLTSIDRAIRVFPSSS